MWLLNHRAARKFEIPMMKKIGIAEIFLPKKYPQSISFRSADVDYTEDEHLTIPRHELCILNSTDWYKEPNREAWDIANKYFDVLFFIAQSPEFLKSLSSHFKGAVIWRAYGLDRNQSYTKVLRHFTKGINTIEKIGKRFWFGQAYEHLHEIEEKRLSDRKIYLPLGMDSCRQEDEWTGQNRRIFFICPDIGYNPYYKVIHDQFYSDFKEFPYSIGGSQPIKMDDPNVLGFIPKEQYARNMREFRVMFYHSTEPNHVHYHPFEAIRAGMPLVFMAGSMFDRLGGKNLPGRCQSIHEAQDKIRRILNDDCDLIKRIRETQVRLLDPMRPENCEPAWRTGFAQILNGLEISRKIPLYMSRRRKRIAVILPINYRGGSFRGAKLVARALWDGSRQHGQDAEIIFAHPNDPDSYPEEAFDDLPVSIVRRVFIWDTLDAARARRAMIYAGHRDWSPAADSYITPDDGIQQFLDCDAWVIISDRLSKPLLPIRPYTLVVYDYLQRYVPVLDTATDQAFLHAARLASSVIVTTRFTEQDALQYAGLEPEKVRKVPMLVPEFTAFENAVKTVDSLPYFMWTTNAGMHKNHINAFKALRIYYEELGGALECRITGVNTRHLLESKLPHLQPLAHMMSDSQALREHVRILGELPDMSYQKELAGADFLWHTNQVDNGTFSAVEAAHSGVPTLSCDYPAMREINAQFQLNIAWMKADDPRQMAAQLKWMEKQAKQQCALLPTKTELAKQSLEKLASQYWEVVRECL